MERVKRVKRVKQVKQVKRVKRVKQVKKGWRSEAGQTLTEYLMILGVLTAVMISISALVRPMITWLVVEVTQHEAVHLSTPKQ